MVINVAFSYSCILVKIIPFAKVKSTILVVLLAAGKTHIEKSGTIISYWQFYHIVISVRVRVIRGISWEKHQINE